MEKYHDGRSALCSLSLGFEGIRANLSKSPEDCHSHLFRLSIAAARPAAKAILLALGRKQIGKEVVQSLVTGEALLPIKFGTVGMIGEITVARSSILRAIARTIDLHQGSGYQISLHNCR